MYCITMKSDCTIYLPTSSIWLVLVDSLWEWELGADLWCQSLFYLSYSSL